VDMKQREKEVLPEHVKIDSESLEKNEIKPEIIGDSETVGFWDWVSQISFIVSFFFLLIIIYRWIRFNPDLLNFITQVITIITIGSLFGLQTEVGEIYFELKIRKILK